MWAEWGISQLFFNIVHTNTDAFVPPLHKLEEPFLVKVGVLGTDKCPYGCFTVLIGGETAPLSVLYKVGKKWKSLDARSGL
jgi:hypothetical protein